MELNAACVCVHLSIINYRFNVYLVVDETYILVFNSVCFNNCLRLNKSTIYSEQRIKHV